ncbi:hypothetical protein JKF63_03440 [Porcisia hertigi]|uniref:Uncharacterized protein n=1 Tax=Porcisia hertigi TaxID=2761500 RepID=A0A836LGT9_9TRYP|nr:hypothetical protein JKF63_03440 [Porcisia hertigi]
MSTAHDFPSDWSSWSLSARGEPSPTVEAGGLGVVQSQAGVGQTDCETPKMCTRDDAALPDDVTATALDSEANAAVLREKDDGDERLSESSAESWVELNPAELCAPCEVQRTSVDTSASARVVDVVEPLLPLPFAPEGADRGQSVEVLEMPEEIVSAQISAQEPSYALLRGAGGMDVSALTRPIRDNAATTSAPQTDVVNENAGTEQFLLFLHESIAIRDGVSSVDCDGAQGEETVGVGPESAMSIPESVAAAHPAPMVGVTEVLRRRVIQEDFFRTERGPSELSTEERQAILRALLGDLGDAPISAEKFRELMVPYQRQCECLGGSYGFHHQRCQLFSDYPVSF